MFDKDDNYVVLRLEEVRWPQVQSGTSTEADVDT
jgi:hypothetical protein